MLLPIIVAQQQAHTFQKRKLLDEPNPDWAEPTERQRLIATAVLGMFVMTDQRWGVNETAALLESGEIGIGGDPSNPDLAG